MPSMPAVYRATLSLKCRSFELRTIVRMRLPGNKHTQLIIVVSAKGFDDDEEKLIPMPLTPNLSYDKVLIYRLTDDEKEIGEPLRITLDPKDETNDFVVEKQSKEVESKGGSV